MRAEEIDRRVVEALGDDLARSAEIAERTGLSRHAVAASLGRLRRLGRARRATLRCGVCDGRGRLALWSNEKGPD